VQSGVLAQMGLPAEAEHGETTPKHLRTGVNAAQIGYSAVALLLIEKGVITELEFFSKLADLAEDEKHTYEQRLSEYYENPVKLS
jgi:hypothetical protein